MNQEQIISSINNSLAAIEAMNGFLDDNNKLSTSAIREVLETNGAGDITKALEEANKIKASGNPYGDSIIEGLNAINANYVSNFSVH